MNLPVFGGADFQEELTALAGKKCQQRDGNSLYLFKTAQLHSRVTNQAFFALENHILVNGHYPNLVNGKCPNIAGLNAGAAFPRQGKIIARRYSDRAMRRIFAEAYLIFLP